MTLTTGLVTLWLLAGPLAATPASELGLSLADLAPYRAALEGKPGGLAEPVTFRQLWDDPGHYQGRRVRVEGRIVRRFRQAAFGTFPPLVEAWAVSPAGDPLCLVFPAGAGAGAGSDAAPVASVRFEGTFLRRLRYQGADSARLAPLIVGARPPTVTSPAPKPARRDDRGAWPWFGTHSWADWALGLAAAVVVAVVLALRHARGPSRGKPAGYEPPPEFDDGSFDTGSGTLSRCENEESRAGRTTHEGR